MNIKGIIRCIVYILQEREIMERRHHISVYRVNIILPYLPPLANNKSRNNIQILETEVKGVSIYI